MKGALTLTLPDVIPNRKDEIVFSVNPPSADDYNYTTQSYRYQILYNKTVLHQTDNGLHSSCPKQTEREQTTAHQSFCTQDLHRLIQHIGNQNVTSYFQPLVGRPPLLCESE